ncbi:MAG: class I SAM-dependent methyltransferase [Betaproteobacteria bacterium]
MNPPEAPTRLPSFEALPWEGADRLRYGDVAIDFCVGDDLTARQSTDDTFVLGKSPSMLASMLGELRRAPACIVDVGVYKGGSVVLLNEVFRPDALLALELNPRDQPPLRRYVARHGHGRVAIRNGTDQANRPAVHAAVDTVFGARPLDLVIDDASHWYPQTLATFTALFPRLAPGGLYVIEDWGWAHWPGAHWQAEFGGDYFANQLPLSNLIIDLMLLAAARPDVFPRVVFDSVSIYVARGEGEIARDFDLASIVLNRGQQLPRFGPGKTSRQTVFESPSFVFRGPQG